MVIGRVWGGLVGEQLWTGLGRAAILPATQSRVHGGDLSGAARSRRVAGHNAAAGLGMVAGRVVEGMALAAGRAAVSTACAALAGLLLAAMLLLSPDGGGPGTAGRARAPSVPWSILWASCLLMLVAGVPFTLVASFYPVYALYAHSLGWGRAGVSYLDGVGGVAFIGAGALLGPLTALAGRGAMTWVSLAVLALATVATSLLYGPWVLGLVMLAANVAAVWVASESTLRVVHGVPRECLGWAFAMVGTAWSLSLLVMPLAFGLTAAAGGTAAAFWEGGGLAAVAVIVLALRGESRRPPRQPGDAA